MKTHILFLSLIFYSFSISAQQVTSDVKATLEKDNFTGTKKIITEKWSGFGKNSIGRTISANLLCIVDGVICIYLTYNEPGFGGRKGGDIGCFSEYRSKIQVKLTNDNIIEFTQITQTDCSNSPSAIFYPLNSDELKLSEQEALKIAKANIELLKEYDWVAIRVTGSEFYMDIEPNPSRNLKKPEQFFRQHIIAIMNNNEN